MERLYVVVRADLPAGAQLAQAVHAGIAFALRNWWRAARWFIRSNNLAVLAARAEAHLAVLISKAPGPRIELRGPDLKESLSAVAFGGDVQKLFSSLPLALRWRSVENAA